MILSIASGKGGTGKTTVAVNLAISLEDVQLLDCDVEEPNANIFVKADLKRIETIYREVPDFDLEKCNLCGACADFCAYNAIAVTSKKLIFFPELCHSCGGCGLVCRENAIRWKKKEIGEIYRGCKDGIEIYQGKLRVGESIPIPVIRRMKELIDRSKNVIIDSPPGVGCPFVESVKGSDFCLLVTEPTPFGLYDLKIAVEVVRKLKVPFGVVVNKDGGGYKEVDLFCRSEDIPILLRIPHSEEIARLYSLGVPFSSQKRKWREEFERLFESIEDLR